MLLVSGYLESYVHDDRLLDRDIDFWISDQVSKSTNIRPDALLPENFRGGTEDYLLRLSRNFGILLRLVGAESHNTIRTYTRVAGIFTQAWRPAKYPFKSSLYIV